MKKVVLILVPVVLLATVAALGLLGIIKIPGLSPTKAKAKASQLYSESDTKLASKSEKPAESPPVSATPKPAAPVKTGPLNKPEIGQKKLAKLWNEIEPAALVAVTKDWKESELAPILLKMDSAKVAQFLTMVDPKRASTLSRQMQQVASTVPRETESQS